MSKIEWTEKTWNPIVGCTKISAGCKNCYAETMAKRLQAMGIKGYENGFKLNLMPNRLSEPFKNKKPTTYFVCSMSDLFHEGLSFGAIDRIFSEIYGCDWHKFQILTKRPKIMLDFFRNFTGAILPRNCLFGTSIENRASLERLYELRDMIALDSLRRTKDAQGRVKLFLSVEPLLEDLGELDLSGIDWVIVGGESGHNARPMKKEWVLNIQRQCKEQGVAFFFKQWGTYGEDGVKRSKKSNGRLLEGQEFNEGV